MQHTLNDDKIILVTGGAGFIGSAVIKELNDKGISKIVVVDDLDSSEKWQNLVGKKYIELVPIAETFTWIKANQPSVGAVIHLGACSSTVEKDAKYLHENNTRFSQRLYEAVNGNGCRFIYASSAATYGDGSKGFSDDESKLDALQPLNMYGYSKHLFDLWLRDQAQFKNASGLKYFNVYGPNEYHKGRMSSALFHMYPVAKSEKVVKLFKSSEPSKYSDGGQMRDFLYVKDAVRMTCAFLENDATGIFNIGSGNPATWNSVAENLFSSLKIDGKIQYIPMPEDLIGKYQNYSAADMEKTKKSSWTGSSITTIVGSG
ncbi:MAG: ADP-glyceromanno-heptose 6-epimerase [Parachlamydiaceae bacterium]